MFFIQIFAPAFPLPFCPSSLESGCIYLLWYLSLRDLLCLRLLQAEHLRRFALLCLCGGKPNDLNLNSNYSVFYFFPLKFKSLVIYLTLKFKKLVL